MKRIIQFCFLMFLAQAAVAQSVIYVNGNAAGVNNGSSWADAYNNLDLALANAVSSDQIWIVAGTYKPSEPAPGNTFVVAAGVAVYGGFAGTETMLTQRNPAANLTILSGDIAGDDIPGNYTLNRTDNSIHVVNVLSTGSSDRAIIDGVTVKGGTTLVGANDPAAMKRGAGILVEAKVTINNCYFTDNYAESGSSIMAPGTTANGLIVSNCLFEKNDVSVRSAGIYIIDLALAEISNCTFRENKVVRGCIYPRSCAGLTITNCLFQDNTNNLSDGFGTGIFNYQSTYTISDCQFIGNSGGSAVSIYNDNREGGDFVTMKKCLFDGNVATNYGGCGVHNFKATYSIDSCIFRNNMAPTSAGAIYNSDSTYFTVSNSLFEGQTASYAACVANYGLDCVGTFQNCTFQNNLANNGGGACSNGFKADVLYKDCLFKGNTANFGGAIFTQNDTTRLRVEGCIFTENNAATSGGGAIYKNSGIHASIRTSTFTANTADNGGDIFATGDSAMVVERCIFTDNFCLTQAGAVNLSNTDASFTNCLFARNFNLGAGAGGAILNNASDGLISTLSLVNCTIGDNIGSLGAGIAQWEDDTSNAVLHLQNCIIQNPEGDNYAIEAGDPEVISHGGNHCSDLSLAGDLSAAKDMNEITTEFVSPDAVNYHLLNVGPAVDGGIAAGAPLNDLDGVARIGDPDAGCYEFGTVGIHQPALEVLPLQLAPNPTASVTMVSLNNSWNGNAVLEIIAENGAIVRSIAVEKTAGLWQQLLPVSDLPSGNYQVMLKGEGQLFRAGLSVR